MERAGTTSPRDVRGSPAKVPSRLSFPNTDGRVSGERCAYRMVISIVA